MTYAYRILACSTLLLSSCLLCTDEGFLPVLLTIDEVGGASTETISVRYRVDEGPWVEIADTTGPTSRNDCNQRTQCGFGSRFGSYEIEVSRGMETVTAEVTVDAGRCMQGQERVTVQLP